MEIILLCALIGWISSFFEEQKRERERLEKWRLEHPNWQDVLGG